MAFTRDDLDAYEKLPQTQVADTQEHLMKGATPSKTATAEQVAAASKNSVTPDTKNQDDNDAANPSGDNDDEPVSQTETGEDGASDENADSSTASADPSGESETTETDEGKKGDEAPANQHQPKKGSAAERLQEVLDLMAGYKEFGKHMQTQLQEALAENARLKGSGTQAPVKENAPPVEETEDPMPDLSDKDVNFDQDKLRAKTKSWIDKQIEKGTKRAISQNNTQTEAERVRADVDKKLNTFATTHPDFKAVALDNPVLIANQLSRDAAREVALSDYTADILYAFGKDPAMAVKLAKQSTARQLVAIGELISKIKADKAAEEVTAKTQKGKTPAEGAKPTKQKSQTNAPPPPSPTRASGSPNERDIQDPNMSMEEFARRHRQERQIQRAQNRKQRGLA